MITEKTLLIPKICKKNFAYLYLIFAVSRICAIAVLRLQIKVA